MSNFPAFVLRQQLGEIESVAFQEQEQNLVSGDNQGWLTIWDLDKRRPCSSIQPSGTSIGILSVLCFPSHSWVVTQSRDGIIRLLDSSNPATNQSITSIKTNYEGFCKTQRVSEYLVASPGQTGHHVEFWNLKSTQKSCLKLVTPDVSKFGSISNIGVCQGDENSVFVGYENGVISHWDIRQPKIPIFQESCASSPVTCIGVDPKATRVIVGSCDAYFTGVKLGSVGSKRKVEIPEEGLSAVQIRTDRVLFATGGWDAKLRVWSYRSMKPLAVLKYHDREITTLCFSSSEKSTLVTGSRDGTIAVWNVFG